MRLQAILTVSAILTLGSTAAEEFSAIGSFLVRALAGSCWRCCCLRRPRQPLGSQISRDTRLPPASGTDVVPIFNSVRTGPSC